MRIHIQIMAMMLALGSVSVEAHDAQAPGNSTQIRFEIQFGDLDLTTEHDAQVLLQRIDQGARKACSRRSAFGTYTGDLERNFRSCRESAVRDALRQLRAPLVARLYQQSQEQKFARQSTPRDRLAVTPSH